MTVIAQPIDAVAPPSPREPAWCNGHLQIAPSAVLHQHELEDEWGAIPGRPGSGRLTLALEREDDEHGVGAPRINIYVSLDGFSIDGTVLLPIEEAEDFLGALAHLVHQARRCRH